MNVLVTGGTGFVGNHLIPKLLDNHFNILCLVRDNQKAEQLKKKYNVRTILGDVTNPQTLKGISKDIDYVIHLAAVGHISAVTEESYNLFVGTNEAGTRNLIDEFSNSKQLKKFIHFSSTAAMGPIGLPILDEKSIPNPITPYQKSKQRSEQIITEAYQQKSFPGLILRPCMIYGPGGYGEFHKFCRLMKKGMFPKVGLGKNLTPLVYVDDVVSATILALEKGKAGETYIIASQQSIPMDNLHKYVMESLGTKSPYIYIPGFMALVGAKVIEKVYTALGKEPIVTYNNIKSTITDRTFNIKKAQNELGYMPRCDFKEGIRKTVEWYKSENRI